MEKFLESWKKFVTWLSVKGIPVPLLRNPRSNEASVSFTMLVVTFAICTLALIGRVASSTLFESIHFANAFELFIATSALYFGRSFQKGTMSANVQNKPPEEKK